MSDMMKSRLSNVIVVAAGLVISMAAVAKLFVPDIEPWDMWIIADQNNTATIDHSDWQQILNVYLVTDTDDGITRFDYGAVTGPDQVQLDEYVARLTALDPRKFKRIEQMPYWINLYNAVTVQLVLDYYPVYSIRSIKGGMLSPGPWKEELVTVAGQPLSLNDIEHRILRPIWRDPRIHYAVNCASLGCPNLAAEAYTPKNLETLLDAGATAYVNHPRGVSFADGQLTLSSIYDWYDTDFGADQAEVLEQLASYAQPPLAEQLRSYDGRIQYDYDWQLNAPADSD